MSSGGPESSRLNWARSRVYIGLVVFDYFIRVFSVFRFFLAFSGFGVFADFGDSCCFQLCAVV